MTAAPQSPAAATRLKPEWIALLEKLVPHFSGITESSGEAESGVKKPAMHLGAKGLLSLLPGRGRGAARARVSAPRRKLWRMRPGRR